MPRNRRPRDREEKSSEIVVAAADLFTEIGFEKTTIASVARAAGVTTTTIYWYFKDKDTLLVAVLDHLLGETLHSFEGESDEDWVDRLVWVVERLNRYEKLVTAVHALAADSAVIDAWHEEFHEMTNGMLAYALVQSGVPEDRVVPTTRMGVFAIEGLLMHPLPRDEQRAVLALVMNGHR